ncbi:hypothetical protein FRC12_020878, partial [Ceratobasidium sp. 428]
MPIVARRFLATSRGPKSGANVSKAPKSAFADRFGQSDKQLQHAQSSFPAWPSALSPQQGLSQSNSNTLRRLPPNLLTLVGKEKEEDDRSKKMSGSHTSSERRRELFSEAIGNVSELVRTSSFEAKLAIQPAMEARRQLLLAAKTNMHRFSSLPSPAQYKVDQKEVSESSASAPQNAGSTSIARFDNSSPNLSPKTNSRTVRPLPTFPPSHRTLSTSSVGLSTFHTPTTIGPPLAVLGGRAHTQHPPTTVPFTNNSLWRECVAWVLDITTEHRFRSSPPTSIIHRLYSIPQHFMYSNRVLSLLHPTIYALPMLARGYTTRRTSSPLAQNSILHSFSSLETPIRALSSSSSSSTDANAPCVVIPAPTTSVELCNAMRHLIQSATPRPKVARLISTHSQYPTLHTVTSFNILLAHAIRVAPYYSRPIIAQMRASNIVWDATTQKLAVRAHIQVGQWPEAVELAERTWLPEGGSGVSTAPLDVFIELMHFVLTPGSTQGQVSTMARRCWRLFPTDANVNASPRLAYNVVRLL